MAVDINEYKRKLNLRGGKCRAIRDRRYKEACEASWDYVCRIHEIRPLLEKGLSPSQIDRRSGMPSGTARNLCVIKWHDSRKYGSW